MLEFGPSRLRVILLVTLHAAAAFSCVLGFASPWIAAPVGLVIAASLFREVKQALGQSGRLELQADGCLTCCVHGMLKQTGRVRPESVVLHRSIWLVWDDGGRRATRWLLPDQMSASDWRALQVWLRLRVARTIAEPDSDAA